MNSNSFYSIYDQRNSISEWAKAERFAYCEQPTFRSNGLKGLFTPIVRIFLAIF